LPRSLPSRIDGPVAAIGDIHGQSGELRQLLDQLRCEPDFAERWVVFLGDFLDRGPSPRAALDLVLALAKEHPKTTAVMGNHDLALLGALGLIDAPTDNHWPKRYLTSYNCSPTFRSYGVSVGDLPALARAMPDAHKEFLAALPWSVEHPHYLFVHAGLEPARAFESQLAALRQRDVSHNRPPWLCSRSLARQRPPADCTLTVVSGHVPVPSVRLSKQRLLLDTSGGYGHLSCVLLPENRILTTRR